MCLNRRFPVSPQAAPVRGTAVYRPAASPTDPGWLWTGKVPCLDGLRAVAILCVVAHHIFRDLALSWEVGHFGVTAFFVISGFLITLLLVRERAKTGRISLKGFYKRRVLRIMPAYTAFLLVIGGLQVAGAYRYTASAWLAAVTYSSSFFSLRSMGHNLAHTWSLSVEEHFYLLWPPLFMILKPKRALVLLAVYAAAVTPVLRWGMGSGRIPLDSHYSSPSQMSSIAVGCMLALAIAADAAPRLKALLFVRAKWLPAMAAGVICLGRAIPPELKLCFSDSLKSLAFVLILAWLLLASESGWTHRLLASRPMVWLGILSYSIYLWQQPLTEEPRIPGGRVGRLTALAAMASLSHFVVERPFLRMKRSPA
jgi:peptidoglycan/LPS O-acetylase OafA/YrhL